VSGFFISQEGNIMDNARIRELITEKSVDGKLTCQDAHTIAEHLGIHLSLVGKECNEEGKKIKITACLLGCF
jgi:LAO/AO transport system kinase